MATRESRSIFSLIACCFMTATLACRAAPAASTVAAANGPPRYALVASNETLQDAQWKAVAEALLQKRSGKLFVWDGRRTDELRLKLAEFRPRYVCFLARAKELTCSGTANVRAPGGRSLQMRVRGVYYHQLSTLMRRLDDDPYDDA
ncbi:MAG TPA: hypothetical protein EYP14_15780, partial [Planctomycetaceae bacterium]|nr:hypothetical protein [Planctomycetaceae bacterium]